MSHRKVYLTWKSVMLAAACPLVSVHDLSHETKSRDERSAGVRWHVPLFSLTWLLNSPVRTRLKHETRIIEAKQSTRTCSERPV